MEVLTLLPALSRNFDCNLRNHERRCVRCDMLWFGKITVIANDSNLRARLNLVSWVLIPGTCSMNSENEFNAAAATLSNSELSSRDDSALTHR